MMEVKKGKVVAKRHGKTGAESGAVDRLLEDLYAEYAKLTPAEQKRHLNTGAAIVASRKRLLSKLRLRVTASARPSGRIRAAR